MATQNPYYTNPFAPDEVVSKTVEEEKPRKVAYTGKRIPFRLSEALQDGATYQAIASHLAQQAGRDYAKIRNDGVTDKEIIDAFMEHRELTEEEARGEGIAKGLVSSTAIMAPALAGAKLGAIPGGVPGAVVGGATGLLVGLGLDAGLKNVLFPDEGEIGAQARSAYITGETAGGILPVIATPYAVPAKFLPGFFQKIQKSAELNPISFISAELTSGASSVAGAYLAENMAPGQFGKRLTAEVMAGVLNPVNRVIRLGPPILDQVKRVGTPISALTQSGRAKAAERLLFDVLNKYGTDFDVLIRQLNESDELANQAKAAGIPFLDRSSAALTGNKALLLIERSLAARNMAFDTSLKEGVESQLSGVYKLLNLMNKTENPDIVRQAAQLRNELLTGMLESRLAHATDRVTQAVSKLDMDDPEAAARASQLISKTMESSPASFQKLFVPT